MGAAGRKIGGYQIERELAQGGMGVVYLARQPALERPVVLKTLRRDLAEDGALEERFQREAQAAASVHHQNVVAVYDCFTWRGEQFIAQEYVEGENLASILERASPLPPRLAGLVALELARALEEIHALGIVHRDLKPSNVLVGCRGEVKIADFGIALSSRASALTQTGQAVGTPLYMSPEQLRGERADGRSDLFSLGLVLYEMLCGEAPFAEAGDGEPGVALLRRIERGRYASPRRRAPGVPRALARLIRSCLRARPRRRPTGATAARLLLERHLGALAPSDCRAEIALGMDRCGALPAAEGGTRPQPHAVQRPASGRLRWAAAAALTATALLATAAAAGLISIESLPFLRISVLP